MRIALPPAIAAAAFAGHDPAAACVTLGGETMGTRWQVACACPPGLDAAATGISVAALLDRIVAEMSHWEPASLLSRYNRAAAGRWIALPPDFATVIETGLAIARESGGAFDPAIGRLVDAWGFGAAPVSVPPSDAMLTEARARSGWERLAFDPAGRRLLQPGGLALDLSGIAKGHAVDAVADLLATLGIRHALVEIGGELVGRGIRPDGDPWWVELEVPPGLTLPPLRIALVGLGVATSGDYRRGGHTLDPRTGRSTANGVVAASVIAATAREADAWATALAVLGATDGIAAASRAGLASRIVTVADGVAREHLSPALAAMLED